MKEAIQTAIETGGKTIKGGVGSRPTSDLSLFRIGKPARFTEAVDPDNRIAEYIESKMNVIDLIPCDFSIPLTKVLDATDAEDKNVLVDAIKPNIDYDSAIIDFGNICKQYGLPYGHGGLRIFLTDDTTATDEFSNVYQENILGSFLNKFAGAANQINTFGRSVTSRYEDWIGNILNRGEQFGQQAAAKASQLTGITLGENAQYIASLAGHTAKAAARVVLQGNKLSLPQVWSDSNYSPNFNAVVKLVSPYGHPDAVREFIIKPLMYLLILAGARTRDGISYGQNPKVTVKAYGITFLPLATISGISLRKGGADTSYNIYRQPLTVDVSITFQSLLKGFAIHKQAINDPMNTDVYGKANQIDTNLNLPMGASSTFFSTLGSVVQSIKPVAINKVSRRYTKSSGLPNIPANSEGDSDSMVNVQTTKKDSIMENNPFDVFSNRVEELSDFVASRVPSPQAMDQNIAESTGAAAAETNTGQSEEITRTDYQELKDAKQRDPIMMARKREEQTTASG